MPFTFDELAGLIEATALNPVLASIPLCVLHFYYKHPLLFSSPGPEKRYYSLPKLVTTPAVWKSLYLLTAALAYRWTKRRTRIALNNGVKDKTWDWSKEVVVITGGAGGIGAEIVKKLATKGTKIAVIDLLPLSFDPPENVKWYKVNILSVEDLQGASAQIRKDFGDPTVLVANAAIVRPKPLLETSARDTELTFGVNNIGLIQTYKEFVPAMIKANHGHIITTASTAGFLAVVGMVDYSATKAATIALHEGLRTELKVLHNAPAIRTTLVCPSTTRTNMFKGLRGSSAFLIPVKEPSYVADLVVDAIWAGESRQIVLPTFQSFSCSWLRAFPAGYRIALQEKTKDLMKTFDGHRVLE